MFEYLSFLRPPAYSVVRGQPVTLVPQIANDLRTELCEQEYGIYFTWQHSNGHLHHGNFAKLTTWRLGGTYKPLGVALPAEAQPGDSWRLCLVVVRPGQSPSLTIDLSQPAFGQLPFPVISMPIDIVSDQVASSSASVGSKHGKRSRQAKQTQSKSPVAKGARFTNNEHQKQERIERLYLLPPSPDSITNRILRITEQTSFDLDKKIWDSGVALSACLAQLLDTRTKPESLTPKPTRLDLIDCLRNRLVQSESQAGRAPQIIELGAGTGLVSLVLGALLSGLQPVSDTAAIIRTRILATDLPSAIDLIEHNRAANEHLFRGPNELEEAPSIELRGIELDWDKPISDDIWDGRETGFDVIVMADVTYNTGSFPALLDTVIALLNGPSPSSASPMILLAYKCRDPSERTLWRDAAARGISFVQVDCIKGAREPAVEVWLGGWEKAV
ncbi:hypothetical protein FS749_012966, partial [Ceratobasidium sp. UAMH 11750]